MSASAVGLAAATAILWAVAAIFDKLALTALPPRTVFFARLYLLFVILLAPLVLTWEKTRLDIVNSDRKAIFYLLGSVAFSYGGMYVYYFALSLGQASRVVPFCAVYPAIAFALALIFLKEPFSVSALAGTMMVVGGAYLLARS